jgi:hypothetical protein
MTGNFFAVLFLCFGVAAGVVVSVPPEQRIFNVFFFGLLPALAFRLGGYFLSRSFLLSSELCEKIGTTCFDFFTRITRKFAKWLGALMLQVVARLVLRARHFLPKLYQSSYKTYATVNRFFWRACANLIELFCLLLP